MFAAAQQVPESKYGERVFAFPTGNRSYLGIQTREISAENFAKFGLSEVRGVGVEKVVENSPAAQAGLQKGDVIVEFDGEKVSSVRRLTNLISEVAPDHKATLKIVRGGGERELSVTMGKRAMPEFEQGMLNSDNFPSLPPLSRMGRIPFPPMQNGQSRGFVWNVGARRQIGIDVTPLTKQLGDYFGLTSGKGLLVDNVLADSPAAKAGLKAGDIITEADGQEVSTNSDLIKSVNSKKEGNVTLTIFRDKSRQTLTVMPENTKQSIEPTFEMFESNR